MCASLVIQNGVVILSLVSLELKQISSFNMFIDVLAGWQWKIWFSWSQRVKNIVVTNCCTNSKYWKYCDKLLHKFKLLEILLKIIAELYNVAPAINLTQPVITGINPVIWLQLWFIFSFAPGMTQVCSGQWVRQIPILTFSLLRFAIITIIITSLTLENVQIHT